MSERKNKKFNIRTKTEISSKVIDMMESGLRRSGEILYPTLWVVLFIQSC